ncbi:MAG: hypothetical protein H7235_07330, partial [Bdellovibrionaceae bacterium]|nr:hypothetical protein [Pseudobdellovibrionaceae bacterium]
LIFFLLQSVMLPSVFAAEKFRKAQAIRPDVEIYGHASFDAKIIYYIKPGDFYYISNKTFGPFYKIKVSDKILGYVADTELNIQGVGAIQEKPFVDEPEVVGKNKKNKKEKDPEDFYNDEDEEDENIIKTSYNGLILHLINYHEKTMNGSQVADLYGIGYRYIPFLSDYSASIAWDITAAYGAPAYYKDTLNADTKGLTIWSGAQVVNISIVDTNKTLRYGIGGFLKYANYNVTSKATDKTYSLQELTFGVSLEGGFIFHFSPVSLDLGLRYYWERESYGGLSIGLLF